MSSLSSIDWTPPSRSRDYHDHDDMDATREGLSLKVLENGRVATFGTRLRVPLTECQ